MLVNLLFAWSVREFFSLIRCQVLIPPPDDDDDVECRALNPPVFVCVQCTHLICPLRPIPMHHTWLRIRLPRY